MTRKSNTIDMSEYGYSTTKVVGKGGKTVRSTGNGDAIQRAMAAFKASGKDVMQVVRANKLDVDRYNPKKFDNMGLLRMSIGNSLRAMVRAGTPVTIGDIVVKTLAQRVSLETATSAKPRKPRARKAAPESQAA